MAKLAYFVIDIEIVVFYSYKYISRDVPNWFEIQGINATSLP